MICVSLDYSFTYEKCAFISLHNSDCFKQENQFASSNGHFQSLQHLRKSVRRVTVTNAKSGMSCQCCTFRYEHLMNRVTFIRCSTCYWLKWNNVNCIDKQRVMVESHVWGKTLRSICAPDLVPLFQLLGRNNELHHPPYVTRICQPNHCFVWDIDFQQKLQSLTSGVEMAFKASVSLQQDTNFTLLASISWPC